MSNSSRAALTDVTTGSTLDSPPASRVDTPSSTPFSLEDLDLKDTTILKGLAIIQIVLHNFFHWIGPTNQNEFTFNPDRFPLFLVTVVKPALALQAIFTFFGHFGVQVFIFLSAYGLTKSHWDGSSTWGSFMWSRIKKLYPVFLLIVIPWYAGVCANAGMVKTWHSIGPEFVCMLLGISTLLGYGLPVVGPWWFIPFIMQFYAIWLPMRKLARRFGWQGLALLFLACLIAVYTLNPLLAHWNINLMQTPIGRMSGLCLGVFAARYPLRMNSLPGAALAVAGTILVVLGSFYAAFFPLTFLGAILVWLWTYTVLRAQLRRLFLLELVGRYSLVMFLLNGLVRIPFMDYATTPGAQLLFGGISLVITFGLSGIVYELLLNPRGLRSAFQKAC